MEINREQAFYKSVAELENEFKGEFNKLRERVQHKTPSEPNFICSVDCVGREPYLRFKAVCSSELTERVVSLYRQIYHLPN